MFLKHLATPIEPLRDPLGGRDPQFEEPCYKKALLYVIASRKSCYVTIPQQMRKSFIYGSALL